MYVVDSHCDSLADFGDGIPCALIKPYNYSAKYPQLQFAAAFCGRPGDSDIQCYNRAKRFISSFLATVEAENKRLICVRSYGDVERSQKEEKHAVMLTVEGAGSAISANRSLVRDFYDAGARVIGLAWESNALAKSNRLAVGEEDTGLSSLGKETIGEINSLGMISDVSHLSDRSFYDIAELSSKPIIASHSNFRSVCAHTRNLTDAMARLIFEHDGMIGLNLFPDFISEDVSRQTVEGLFEHLDHGLALGGENHIGFGGDIDGTNGRYPYPLTPESSMHDKIIELMLRHNYSESLVGKIAGKNYLTFLKKYL